jgi:hypothetical protein
MAQNEGTPDFFASGDGSFDQSISLP